MTDEQIEVQLRLVLKELAESGVDLGLDDLQSAQAKRAASLQ